MNARAQIPLLVFLPVSAAGGVLFLGRDPRALAGLGSFLLGYAIAYAACVRETRRNAHAVLRLGERTPLILPFVFFSIPTLFFGLLMMPRSPGPLVVFLGSYLAGAIAYICCGVILLHDLRARDAQQAAQASSPVLATRRKLVLVNPVNRARSGLTVNRSSRFPPLGLGIVAALTPEDYQVTIQDEVIEPFRLERADLVGITAFTSSVGRAYEIAAMYRREGVPVVLGGIHASMCPEEALQFVDAVVVGEAEPVWGDVLRDFEAGKLQRIYRSRPGSLAGLPVPRRELFSRDYLFATVQTSRGCPMDCSFCSVTAFNGRAFRQRPVGEVLDEIAELEQSFLFFVDDNLLGHGKEAEARAIALFKGMVRRKLNKSWFCQAAIDFGKNDEVLYWAARSGCKMVFIGLESEDPEELRTMGKKLNLRASYRDVFRRIHHHGIAVLGAFIFGSDAESLETMERKVRFMLREGVDVMQTTILTPLPGTRLFEQLQAEGRLLQEAGPQGWEHFDMSELTFRPRRIDAALFRSALAKHQRRIYSRWSLARKFLQTLSATGRLEAAFWALNSNRNYRAVGRAQQQGS